MLDLLRQPSSLHSSIVVPLLLSSIFSSAKEEISRNLHNITCALDRPAIPSRGLTFYPSTRITPLYWLKPLNSLDFTLEITNSPSPIVEPNQVNLFVQTQRGDEKSSVRFIFDQHSCQLMSFDEPLTVLLQPNENSFPS